MPVSRIKYDYHAKEIRIPIKIKERITTKNCPEEGKIIYFETVSDITVNRKTYPAGTEVKARIETVSLNKKFGVPSDLIIGMFSIDNNPLNGEIKRFGANRSLWVYPCVCIGSAFFGAGALLAFIRGGHAKINSKEIFYIGIYEK